MDALTSIREQVSLNSRKKGISIPATAVPPERLSRQHSTFEVGANDAF